MQVASYGPSGAAVNVSDPFQGLSCVLLSTYRWFYRWWRQTGDVHASTPYLAKKQGISERTVYRRLAALRRAGLLETDVTPGVERRLRPVVPPPPKHRLRAASPGRKSTNFVSIVSGVNVRGMSGVTPYRDSDALTLEDTTNRQRTGTLPADLKNKGEHVEAESTGAAVAADSEMVKAMAALGVLLSTARKLVQVHGEDSVRSQLQALPHRSARDRAAVLVKSIRESWAVPAAVVEKHEKQHKDAQRRQEKAFRQALEAKQQQERQKLREAFQELPEARKAAYLAEAQQQAAKDSPGAFSVLSGRYGFGPWIMEKALRLFEADGL